jgi:hypothetical protein
LQNFKWISNVKVTSRNVLENMGRLHQIGLQFIFVNFSK